MAKHKFRKTKIVLVVLYTVILILYALFLSQVYLSNQSGEQLNLFGNYYMSMSDNSLAVLSGSDDYQKNDTIIYNSADIESGSEEFKIGKIDSIVVQNDLKVVTIIYGDSTEYVAYSQITGLLVNQIPILGAVLSFLRSAFGVAIIVVVPCVIFLIYQLIALVFYMRSDKTEYDYYDDETDDAEEDDYDEKPGNNNANESLFSAFKTESKTIEDKSEKARITDDFLEPSKPKASEIYSENFDKILSELRYRMDFQDTHQLSKHIESTIEEQKEDERQDLKSYGLQTFSIEDGIEINIDRFKSKELVLRLKNDGSLTIITENYQAEITSEL